MKIKSLLISFLFLLNFDLMANIPSLSSYNNKGRIGGEIEISWKEFHRLLPAVRLPKNSLEVFYKYEKVEYWLDLVFDDPKNVRRLLKENLLPGELQDYLLEGFTPVDLQLLSQNDVQFIMPHSQETSSIILNSSPYQQQEQNSGILLDVAPGFILPPSLKDFSSGEIFMAQPRDANYESDLKARNDTVIYMHQRMKYRWQGLPLEKKKKYFRWEFLPPKKRAFALYKVKLLKPANQFSIFKPFKLEWGGSYIEFNNLRPHLNVQNFMSQFKGLFTFLKLEKLFHQSSSATLSTINIHVHISRGIGKFSEQRAHLINLWIISELLKNGEKRYLSPELSNLKLRGKNLIGLIGNNRIEFRVFPNNFVDDMKHYLFFVHGKEKDVVGYLKEYLNVNLASQTFIKKVKGFSPLLLKVLQYHSAQPYDLFVLLSHLEELHGHKNFWKEVNFIISTVIINDDNSLQLLFDQASSNQNSPLRRLLAFGFAHNLGLKRLIAFYDHRGERVELRFDESINRRLDQIMTTFLEDDRLSSVLVQFLVATNSETFPVFTTSFFNSVLESIRKRARGRSLQGNSYKIVEAALLTGTARYSQERGDTLRQLLSHFSKDQIHQILWRVYKEKSLSEKGRDSFLSFLFDIGFDSPQFFVQIGLFNNSELISFIPAFYFSKFHPKTKKFIYEKYLKKAQFSRLSPEHESVKLANALLSGTRYNKTNFDSFLKFLIKNKKNHAIFYSHFMNMKDNQIVFKEIMIRSFVPLPLKKSLLKDFLTRNKKGVYISPIPLGESLEQYLVQLISSIRDGLLEADPLWVKNILIFDTRDNNAVLNIFSLDNFYRTKIRRLTLEALISDPIYLENREGVAEDVLYTFDPYARGRERSIFHSALKYLDQKKKVNQVYLIASFLFINREEPKQLNSSTIIEIAEILKSSPHSYPILKDRLLQPYLQASELNQILELGFVSHWRFPDETYQSLFKRFLIDPTVESLLKQKAVHTDRFASLVLHGLPVVMAKYQSDQQRYRVLIDKTSQWLEKAQVPSDARSKIKSILSGSNSIQRYVKKVLCLSSSLKR